MTKGKKTGGRKKGTPNKATETIREKLKSLGCDPIEAMAKIAMKAEKEGDTDTALRAYKEVAPYIAPKLKAIEVSHEIDSTRTTGFRISVKLPKERLSE